MLRILVLFVAIGYLGLIVLGLMADKIIFQPHASSYKLPELENSGISDVHALTIVSEKVPITAVYLPNAAARYTLLFSHGNAEDLGDDLPMLEQLRDAGFAVFAYDYRGYGASEGVSSEESLYEDVDASYEYLTTKLRVPPDRIVAFGHSLGCAAAIHLSATHKTAGLIVDAPFLSAFRVLTRVRLLPWDKFNNAEKIGSIHAPVLVIHGRSDEVIPWWHGEQLYELANEPKQHLWVDGAGHDDVLLIAPKRYLSAIQNFASLLESTQRAAR